MNTTTVIAHPYDFTISPASEISVDAWDTINIWCLDRDSAPTLVKIQDFPSFFWVELPERVRGNLFTWDKFSAQKVFDRICKRLGDSRPINFFLKYSEKAYYFKMFKKFPMMMLQFSQGATMRNAINMLKNDFY